MIIKNLGLHHFRNFEQCQLEFSPTLNIFIGDNGQGKTNILEAIYLLIEGSSFRYSKNETLIQLNSQNSVIKTRIENQDLDYNLKLQLSVSKKELSVNEKKTTQEKLNLPPAILFSPESLSIIKESSDERRNLVDQLVGQINKNGRRLIQDFKKTLKTRNRLLKDISQEKIGRDLGVDTLQSLNPLFLKQAAELTLLRINALSEIKNRVETSLSHIHKDTKIDFDYQYIISDKNHKNSDLDQVISALQNRMKELELAEIQSGGSLVGPQKHDVIFLYNRNDSRFYCSQGQQRSIILAFKMAQIVYHHRVHGYYPVLLLDDVLSELDLGKQESLISTLNQTETQTFVSTTDVSLISKLSMSNSRIFNIKNGQIFI
jgi:DNA replication and repair protein RecF